MKKIILVLLMLLILPCLAQNYTITPKEKQLKYKVEIEKTIDIEVPKAKKEVDKIFNEAQNAYLKVVKNPKNIDIYMNFADGQYDMIIDSPRFYLYLKLVKITKKYIYIDEDSLATDFSGVVYDLLEPYFKANKIDVHLLDELNIHLGQNYKQIEKFYRQAHIIVYPEEH